MFEHVQVCWFVGESLDTGCVGRVPSKIFNPPFPVLKAGHSVSYSYICIWLVCYAHGTSVWPVIVFIGC